MGSISDSGRPAVLAFWEYVAFLANSLVFLLIGGREAQMPLLSVLEAAAVAVVLSLVGRAAAVYPIAILFRGRGLALPAGFQHVLWWGGLRGALALALALALPASVPERGRHHHRGFRRGRLFHLRPGLTMEPLMRRLGLIRTTGADEVPEEGETRPA
jgi:CPA1 family monovalent cation:H+ antiporter